MNDSNLEVTFTCARCKRTEETVRVWTMDALQHLRLPPNWILIIEDTVIEEGIMTQTPDKPYCPDCARYVLGAK